MAAYLSLANHVRIGKAEFERMKAALPEGFRSNVHGRTIHCFSHARLGAQYNSTQFYAHAALNLPSVWQHHNRATGRTTYSKLA